MATCANCIHHSLCDYNTNVSGNGKIRLVYAEGADVKCSFFQNTADVVPKSEVDYLKEHLEMWCKKYQKAREEIEKLQADIAQYQLDLHYSVCREDEATERTASKIFDELEYLSMDGKIPMNGYYAELKKKYTEDA